MSATNSFVFTPKSKKRLQLRSNQSTRSLHGDTLASDELFGEVLKFRIDGRTINSQNVDDLYPGLDRLVIRSLQSGDCRQLFNRLQRNLKPQYLLITGKHIHISVSSHTQDVLEKLVEMGATLNLHFYEPMHLKELELMCQYGFDVNERLTKYNNQTPLSVLINKNYPTSMLNVLIKNGARFDLKDNQGQTCLHHACQRAINDTVFDLIVENTPNSVINVQNQFGGTPLDLVYFSAYENPSTAHMRRLHVLLCRPGSKLTRYGMREPNLLARVQYKFANVLSCKEFLFKYRLKDIFDPSIRQLAWCIFLFYDVLRAYEKQNANIVEKVAVKPRLERYFVSMIENGEIPLNKIIFRSNASFLTSSSTSSNHEADQQLLNDTEKSLTQIAQIKTKLLDLSVQTLKLKAICRIKIKREIQSYPNDIVKLNSISKFLQAYLTFYNPFIKANCNDTVL